ncbi:2-oxo acid dehydrogenase subunit E2 [uncultured Cellulomonas sp.]|uniref:2-oxo acid dehydrogenase subunit E2 n=1 Tax=uncultured Cellulomonas sp. TaxID=189682 RepID=UPI0028E7C7E1|nr:2-oxo acid dehydrogenase subunit E2 [uncultured Cellulomonas sp.]
MAERVAEDLNRALGELLAGDRPAYVLGEDVLDPYGGAFKITRGLSTAHPDRVLATPISENGIVGVANGLALAGNAVVVEMMFADFVLLAMDQIVNFAAKSVSMFGTQVPMRLVVRCPVGGNRGYGATHSQSVQKFFVGVPDLEMWEVSPFVGASHILDRALGAGRPAVLIEDKVLYTRRMFSEGHAAPGWSFSTDPTGAVWTRVRHESGDRSDVVLVTGSSTVHRCLEAAERLRVEESLLVEIVVPARLYPCDPGPVLDVVRVAGRAAVVEESTPAGSWGGEVAHQLHRDLWDDLLGPVELITSADSVIPAAPHLERTVLVGVDDVVRRVLTLVRDRPGRPRAPAAPPTTPPAAVAGDPTEAPPTVLAPHLGSNDDHVTLVQWYVADGDHVVTGQPVAAVETSKAAADVEAPATGVVRLHVDVLAECPVGSILATVVPEGGVARPAVSRAAPAVAAAPTDRAARVQEGVAAAVTAGHRDIPAAFVTADAEVGRALMLLDEATQDEGAAIGLAPLLLASLGAVFAEHGELFAPVGPDGLASGPPRADVAVTVDTGSGLYLPVVRGVARLSVADLADRLVELQMASLTGELGESDLDLTGVGMGLSLNLVAGVTGVRPIIMPGLSCMVSVGGVRQVVVPDAGDGVRAASVVELALAHDHRRVNGRPAAELLVALAGVVASGAALRGR